jgi:hypothetical protein
MTAFDWLTLAALVGVTIFLFRIVRQLSRARDWIQRIERTHATLNVRLIECVINTGVNVAALARPRRAGFASRLKSAVGSAALLLALLTPLVLGLGAFHSPFSGPDATAQSLGAAVWWAVVEIPGLRGEPVRRLGPLGEIPVLGRLFVISTLDGVVSIVAMAHGIDGSIMRSALLGAALVGSGDLLSTLIGLSAAAIWPRHFFQSAEPG